jgi:hypothetical protein
MKFTNKTIEKDFTACGYSVSLSVLLNINNLQELLGCHEFFNENQELLSDPGFSGFIVTLQDILKSFPSPMYKNIDSETIERLYDIYFAWGKDIAIDWWVHIEGFNIDKNSKLFIDNSTIFKITKTNLSTRQNEDIRNALYQVLTKITNGDGVEIEIHDLSDPLTVIKLLYYFKKYYDYDLSYLWNYNSNKSNPFCTHFDIENNKITLIVDNDIDDAVNKGRCKCTVCGAKIDLTDTNDPEVVQLFKMVDEFEKSLYPTTEPECFFRAD